MRILLIAAVAKNGVIGKENDLVWRIPTDFKRFKALTSGNYILMGRKTFESLGKPLPNRTHLVITRNPEFEVPEGHHVFESVEEVFIYCSKIGVEKLYVIGGGEIYKQTIGIADELVITEVEASPEGDTYFPEIDLNNWKEVSRESHPADEKNQFPFSFVDYVRIK
ncbi:dihydrofolate reductase [Algoriphagus iocasae]|uniref:Dihydrofolate reductase n=1 Tax=Algoriphagus iocasae TaxID=1836499 RepID=A0A841MN29_9BACT|nr:dihydrofolate reductase [Algoriphagus iocasae]MBB6325626.1 dihydrofolate reductase [Algoriphagus iocasae]